jgi:hypothetical protein
MSCFQEPVILRVYEDFVPMGSIQRGEIGGALCRHPEPRIFSYPKGSIFSHPERRLPESKDLAAAIFAAVMMSCFPRAHASTQGFLDAIRKTNSLKSLWEVQS